MLASRNPAKEPPNISNDLRHTRLQMLEPGTKNKQPAGGILQPRQREMDRQDLGSEREEVASTKRCGGGMGQVTCRSSEEG